MITDVREGARSKLALRVEPESDGRHLAHPALEVHPRLPATRHAVRRRYAPTQVRHMLVNVEYTCKTRS